MAGRTEGRVDKALNGPKILFLDDFIALFLSKFQFL